VTVVNEGTGAQRNLRTDGQGFYVAPEIPIGYYSWIMHTISGSEFRSRSAGRCPWLSESVLLSPHYPS
jgi:hypothetical protein